MEQNFSGKTLEEAIEKASAALNTDQTDFTYEIVEYPSKGFLGIGAKPAVIRVNLEEDEPEPRPAQKKPQAQPQKKPARKPEQPQKSVAQPQKSAAQPQKPAAQQQQKPAAQPQKPAASEPAEPAKPFEPDKPTLLLIENFLRGLMEKMGVEQYDLAVRQTEESRIEISLSGEDAEDLTKKQGEVIDAIQLITALMMNKKTDKYYKLVLDVNGYRQHFVSRLEALAVRTAKQVQKSHRKFTLKPMTAYQRRIVHAKLQGFENITTYSVGEEPNRRVVVAYQYPSKKTDEE